MLPFFVDLASADNKGRYADYKTAGGTAGKKVIGLGTDVGPAAICYRVSDGCDDDGP